jgi:hypothetical protein
MWSIFLLLKNMQTDTKEAAEVSCQLSRRQSGAVCLGAAIPERPLFFA